jgi:hypothetical protein
LTSAFCLGNGNVNATPIENDEDFKYRQKFERST